MLTHISLFSGIGGIDIAANWAGFETVLFVEKDEYCQKVLTKHWKDVPIIGDIRDVTREAYQEIITNTEHKGYEKGLQPEAVDSCSGCNGRNREQGNEETMANSSRDGNRQLEESGQSSSLRTTNIEEQKSWNEHSEQPDQCDKISRGASRTNTPDQPITLITGGFPCQPFSVAGKRKGKADDRYLWPEMLRVIQEFKPTWVVGENVAGIRGMDESDSLLDLDSETPGKEGEEVAEILDGILTDLERIGYEVQAFLIPACGVNAPHRRYRVFIVAHATGGRCEQRTPQRKEENNVGETSEQEPVAHSKCMGRTERASKRIQPKEQEPKGQKLEHLCEGISESETMGNAKQFPVNGITDSRSNTTAIEQEGQKQGTGTVDGTSSENLMVNTMCRRYIPQETEIPTRWNSFINANWWAVEPELGRVAHGIPNRVDRLKCLGNAVVPQQIYPILKAIAEIENESTKA